MAWLQLEPNNLKIFAGHRVADIQSSSSINHWHYIHTSQNPADILSRGTTTEELTKSELWWNGPQFLKDANLKIDNSLPEITQKLPETKTICCLTANFNKTEPTFNLLIKFSSLNKTYSSNSNLFTIQKIKKQSYQEI